MWSRKQQDIYDQSRPPQQTPIPKPVQLLLVNYYRVYHHKTHDEALREVDRLVRYVETNWP